MQWWGEEGEDEGCVVCGGGGEEGGEGVGEGGEVGEGGLAGVLGELCGHLGLCDDGVVGVVWMYVFSQLLARYAWSSLCRR